LETHHHPNIGNLMTVLWKNNIDAFIDFGHNAELGVNVLYAEAHHEQGQGANQTAKAVFGDPFYKELLDYYLLPQILSNYGPPTEVRIMPFPDDPSYSANYKIPFSLVLFYPDQGIFIEYIFPRDKTGSQFNGCPSQTGYLSLITWSPETKLSLTDVVKWNSGLGINELNADYSKPIEEATGTSVNDFYQKYKDANNKACLVTPISIWKAK
jgi:hypothetical protein